jgi:dCMP deaminase
MIQALNIFSYVEVLDKGRIVTPRIQNLREIFMPDEDVSHAIAETYFSGARVVFDGSWRLRWDWNSVAHLKRPEAEGTVSVDELDRTMMRQAFKAAERSTDWWRQVGALLSKDGKPLLTAFNKHQPSEQNPYLYGDPRSQFDAGEMIEMSTALHGEVGIAAQAARRGIATEGLDLYVTTFPCPPCAYAIAEMGIKRLFYAEGYSRLEGEAALLAANVEIIRVDMDE